MELEETIKQIKPLDHAAMESARARQDTLTKPRGSLGRLEELSIQLAGITANPLPSVERKTVIVMAADHGVTREGVSAYPAEVTPQMVSNFLRGGAAINVLARQANARVVVVDMGIAGEISRSRLKRDLLERRIGSGTANLAQGPAMTPEQAEESIQRGIEIAEAEIARGADILATGDMGIGNTTPAAAIACALMNQPPENIAGRGTGVDDEGLKRKIAVIARALDVNKPNGNDPLDVLTKVGGFEIGGLAGVILAAAANRKPVVVDGFISTAAAMIAVALASATRDYMIAAHVSQERGHKLMLEWLGLNPLLDMNMRLGEGTGAALAFHLIEASTRILREMATFDEAGVSEKSD
ncbi:MAG: nicotinate-nucleotide--dimethylbenzimidazole phosphoribosyltransferase [Anaerolineae bacterium]|nr:nicotinate-nucleotide--dimethylbenzimidazole phosphoribosyltransferase [Anaerolineae bacterium]MCI0609182.1 nicotinate-nucleotide--dimethylbenzimidazole phosphoribosyltransferase [Anaerolineae bacterium]